MENEFSVSKNTESNFQDLISRTNEELKVFYQSIIDAKSFNFPNDKVALLAKKLLNKYSSSVIQIDLTSLSTKKSIWIYADDFIDLSKYKEKLAADAITLSHVDFSVVLEDYKDKICDDISSFVSESLDSINEAMKNYVFYLEDLVVKSSSFDDSNNSLKVQLELIIDVR